MRRSGLLLLLAFLSVTIVGADELVVFDNGFTVVVSAWSIEDGALRLVLPDGGEVVARASLIVEARKADGPPGVITWRREPAEPDHALAQAAPLDVPAPELRLEPRPRPASASTTRPPKAGRARPVRAGGVRPR